MPNPIRTEQNEKEQLSLLNDQDWFQGLWEKKNPSAHLGMKDSLIGPKYLRKFEEGFPNSTTISLVYARHFPQGEEAERVAEEILSWVSNQ